MATRKTEPNPAEPTDGVAEAIQKATDKAEERGLLGIEVDPTPNSAYTVAGVLAGEPTPETDEEAAKAARKASRGE